MGFFDGFLGDLFGGSSSKASNNTTVTTDVSTQVGVVNQIDTQDLAQGLGKLANAFQNDAQFQAATGLIGQVVQAKSAQLGAQAQVASAEIQAQSQAQSQMGFEHWLIVGAAVAGILYIFKPGFLKGILR